MAHDTTVDQENLFPDLEDASAESYSTGVLASQFLDRLVANKRITASLPFDENQVQPASIDLRLGPVAYRVRASFLPGRNSVASLLSKMEPHTLDLEQPCVLERNCVYIIPLLEEVNLPGDIWGKANPKSSTGRVDVFTRLIADGASQFDSVPRGYRGPLYVEVVPRAFSVVVRKGTRLNQLRLVRGSPPSWDKHLAELHEKKPLVFDSAGRPSQADIQGGLRLGVDLKGQNKDGIVGYRARPNAPAIDLAKINHYDADDFWEPVAARKGQNLVLNPGDFYILVSSQRVRIPALWAADMVPYDPAVGEFRVHYAGFFDPGFGDAANGENGTPAVLEVRSYEVPFLLEHEQVVARLVYERLLAPPRELYGGSIGSSYQRQGLTLAKQFKRP